MSNVTERTDKPQAVDDYDARLSGECYRCGYDLRGIGDEQPCPECGLLAARSRRATDELHDTRPRWLRRLAWGVRLMLLAIVLGAVWPFMLGTVYASPLARFLGSGRWFWEWLPVAGYDAVVVLLWVGALLLSSREGYEPADRADAWLRRLLPLAAAVPLAAVVLRHVELFAHAGLNFFPGEWTAPQILITGLFTLGSIPLPLLVFYRLRGLAKRARSAHLAEHCLIVGVGTSASLLLALVTILIFEYAEDYWAYWTERSAAAIALMLTVFVAAGLFAMWSMYLLGRFAIAFARASRQLRRKWSRDDWGAPPAISP